MRFSIPRVTHVPIGIALGALGIAILPATAQAVTPQQDVVGGVQMPAHVNPVDRHTASAGARAPAGVSGRSLMVTVTSCSETDLRSAVNAVATAGGTVNLRPGCIYRLTNPEPTNVDSGFLSITATVTINGFGDTITRSSAASFRFFEIDGPNGNLTLNILTLSNGHAASPPGNGRGGAIWIDGTGSLTLFASTVTGNNADVSGGGIENDGGTVTVNASTLRNNTARAGGGMNASGATTITFNSSAVSGNTAATTGAAQSQGGGLLVGGGTTRLNSTLITNNNATNTDPTGSAAGGGVLSSAAMFLNNSPVIGNHATGGNGSFGGGLVAAGGTMTVTNCPVLNNIARGNGPAGGNGGGFFNQTALTATNSPVANNTADGGNGSGNGQGGGIFNQGVLLLTATNSPVSSNTARGGSGGGIGRGGALFNNGASAKVTFRSSPIIGNRALPAPGSVGGGIFNTGTVTLIISPVIGNTPDQCAPAGSVPGCL
jgi:hypothetical protein